MNCAFEFRIYPSASQQEQIERTFGCCRWVYNKCLEAKKAEYESTGKSSSVYDLQKMIPVWKSGEAPWLAQADATALQTSVVDLGRAYEEFFLRVKQRRKPGFPKFKSKNDSKQSYRSKRMGDNIAVLDSRHIKLPKLGSVKARVSRLPEGRIVNATVKRVASGKYFVCVCCTDTPNPQMPQGSVEVLGIDAGICDFMVRSDGVKLANPKNLSKAKNKLAREQRRLSRKQKGSANRAKQKRKVALVHEKVANRRKDAIHKATISAVRESQAIAVEDLNVRGMQKNRHLAKAVSDASMGEVLRQLEYKCAWYGRSFVKVGRFYPSSKTCGCCAAVFDDLTLAMRKWTCPKCGATHDRDLNAAVNIAREGRRILEGTAGHAGTGAQAPTLVEQA